MSKVLKELKYNDSHEWVRVEGDFAYIGITDFAQESLGDVVYVDGGDKDETYKQGDIFGVVESVKAASDLFIPLSGTVVAVNEDILEEPELINEDPYKYWIIKIKHEDLTELDDLLDDQEYLKSTLK